MYENDQSDERTKQMMAMYAKVAQEGQSYFTEVAMPGCRPDPVNPDDIDH
ncbi:hypothetical protein [uncultured Duncaniella sp.]|nr:hypothetical protein [uncultured Duncaniella sp.]